MIGTRESHVIAGLAFATALVSGCREEPPVAPGKWNGPLRSTVATTASIRHPGEVAFEQISQDIAGFGGFFLAGDSVVVYVSDSADALAAEARVRQTLAAVVPSEGDRRLAQATMVVRQATYSFRQLRQWRDQIEDQVLNKFPDAAWIDLDESANQVAIGVGSALAQTELQQALTQLAVPTQAVRVNVAKRVGPNKQVTERVRPVVGGLINAVTFDLTMLRCTFAFNARYNGVDVILTASHCSRRIYRPDTTSTTFYQDTVVSNDLIGGEWYDPLGWDNCIGPHGAYQYCRRYSDALMVQYEPGVDFHQGYLARTTSRSLTWGNSGSLTIDPSHPEFRIVSEQAYPLTGQRVDKMGRVTGWTSGIITATCIDVAGTDGYWRMCSDLADYYAEEGDSGSPVFIWSGGGNDVTLVGIHWGADASQQTSAFSPWGGIVEDFGSMFVRSVEPVVGWIQGPNEVRPRDRFCVWQSVVSGGIPPYSYAWSGVLSGSNWYVGGVVNQSGWLYLTVTDSDGRQDTDGMYITLNQSAPLCT